MNQKEREKLEAREKLREWIKPGDTVYTILRHVSRSGMSRDISTVVLDRESKRPFLHPDYLIAKATGSTLSRKEGIKIGGCGMDMGFALVSNLSYALYGDGYDCTGEGCASNAHAKPRTTRAWRLPQPRMQALAPHRRIRTQARVAVA